MPEFNTFPIVEAIPFPLLQVSRMFALRCFPGGPAVPEERCFGVRAVIKTKVVGKTGKSLSLYRSVPPNEFKLHAELAMHELNHRPRECLGGQNPCQVYHDKTRSKCFTKPERMAIYDWINQTTENILKEVRSVIKQTMATARRKAIESRLNKNNIIIITLNGLNVT